MTDKINVFVEVSPLSNEDCFIINSRHKKKFNYPIHIHPEFELNFIHGGKGARRIVGDSIEEIDDLELCLLGNENLEHAWVNYNNSGVTDIYEITIQFHKNLFLESLLNKKQFRSIAVMFENAKKGIVFSRNTIEDVRVDLINLTTKQPGFLSVIDLLKILYKLSNDSGLRILCTTTFTKNDESSESRRIKKVIDFLHNNIQNEIHLIDVANHVNMSEIAFSRFMKKRAGKSYIEYFNDLRLGVATRALIDSTKTISEISFESGFNNLSNFNRIFKKRKGLTPNEFRENYSKMRILI
jgi:AraC-like DNA-binding protein